MAIARSRRLISTSITSFADVAFRCSRNMCRSSGVAINGGRADEYAGDRPLHGDRLGDGEEARQLVETVRIGDRLACQRVQRANLRFRLASRAIALVTTRSSPAPAMRPMMEVDLGHLDVPLVRARQRSEHAVAMLLAAETSQGSSVRRLTSSTVIRRWQPDRRSHPSGSACRPDRRRRRRSTAASDRSTILISSSRCWLVESRPSGARPR